MIQEKTDTNIIIGVINSIELKPEFIGFEDSLYAFLKNNFTTPKELLQIDI